MKKQKKGPAPAERAGGFYAQVGNASPRAQRCLPVACDWCCCCGGRGCGCGWGGWFSCCSSRMPFKPLLRPLWAHRSKLISPAVARIVCLFLFVSCIHTAREQASQHRHGATHSIPIKRKETSSEGKIHKRAVAWQSSGASSVPLARSEQEEETRLAMQCQRLMRNATRGGHPRASKQKASKAHKS